MAMWLIFIPVIILLVSVIFKLLGNSKQATFRLSITNFLILFLGIDSIVIFLIAGGAFPANWTWSNLQYSIFNGIYSIPLLIGIAAGIVILLIYLHKKMSKEMISES